MNNKGVAIRYGDVAPEAKENFAPTSSESKFDTLAQLQQYNLNFPNYANPCELYQTVLDGTATAFPSMPENENVGLWSEQLSNDDGTFEEPIVITLTSAGQYSSPGLTFTFDLDNSIYPTRLKIKWIRYIGDEETVLDEKEYNPNSAFYFCQNLINNYNKLVITFYSLNMPQNRLKLRVIDYGYGTYFYGNELRNVKLIQEIDPISTQISINTADFVLDSKSNIEYSFQAKQPLSIYFNGQLKATTFVKSAKRQSKFLWRIQSEDYIGLMNSVPYYGGIYVDAKAVDVLGDIFGVAKVPYSIDGVFANATITGYIPYTTCREALMQVVFAIQAVVDTSDSEVVKVFALDNEVKQTIPLNRIMQGQNFTDDETVTGVEVVSHTYKPITETINVYDANESGVGENVFVKFSEPLHDLNITNGTIIQSGTNYAVINANTNCILTGQKYEHTTQTKRRNNPVVLANEIEKIVAVENATLVSENNVDNVLQKCYNWLIKVNAVNLSIVEGKHIIYGAFPTYGLSIYGATRYGASESNVTIYDKAINTGDVIVAETEFLGNIQGIIISQTFSLNGNIIIKKCILK